MKNLFTLLICLSLVYSCKNKEEASTTDIIEKTEVNYDSFGNMIIADDAIAAKSMAAHYNTMKIGDSINSKMKAVVKEVCQAKGCWMTLNLENGEEVMVKFKDYGFFVPKDISGKEVIINGKAFVNEVSVDEQQHYAEDAGKSSKEIAAITKPKRTFSFEADGVLVTQ